MKTSEIFKGAYGITLGYLCAKLTFTCGCSVIKKLCDVGIDKINKIEKEKKEDEMESDK